MGKQLFYHAGIRGWKPTRCKLSEIDPAERLGGFGFGAGWATGDEVQVQLGRSVFDRMQTLAGFDTQAGFLEAFAHGGRLGRFSGLDFAAGKLGIAGEASPLRPNADQIAPGVLHNGDGNDVGHASLAGKNSRRITSGGNSSIGFCYRNGKQPEANLPPGGIAVGVNLRDRPGGRFASG